MITPNIAQFFSVVQNIAPYVQTFDFLGVHGKSLGVGEQYSEPGNLVEKLAHSPRKFQSLERALAGYTDDNGVVRPPTLALLSLPSPIFFDNTAKNVKTLSVVAGVVTVVDPGWGAEETVLTGSFGPVASGSAPVNVITLTFSHPVTGFTVSDLVLARGGVVVPITGVTATSPDRAAYTLTGFAGLDATAGTYVLKCPAAGTGIVDNDQNPLSADVTTTWTKS